MPNAFQIRPSPGIRAQDALASDQRVWLQEAEVEPGQYGERNTGDGGHADPISHGPRRYPPLWEVSSSQPMEQRPAASILRPILGGCRLGRLLVTT